MLSGDGSAGEFVAPNFGCSVAKEAFDAGFGEAGSVERGVRKVTINATVIKTPAIKKIVMAREFEWGTDMFKEFTSRACFKN